MHQYDIFPLFRTTAEFFAQSQVSLDLLDWMQFANVPDEHFYSTLITLKMTQDDVRRNKIE